MPELDLRHGRVVIADTETTGVNQDRDALVEVAALEMVDLRLTGRSFHAYINPRRIVPPDAVRVHGLTNEFLADKPFLEDVLPDYLAFIDGAPFVAHNARFDVGFINSGLASLKRPAMTSTVVDTLFMAKEKLNTSRLSLDLLCDRLGVSRASRTKHGAVVDCEILSEVFIKLVTYGEGGLALSPGPKTTGLSPSRRLTLTPRAPVAATPSGDPKVVALGSASEAEREAHREFVEKIGANIWKKHAL